MSTRRPVQDRQPSGYQPYGTWLHGFLGPIDDKDLDEAVDTHVSVQTREHGGKMSWSTNPSDPSDGSRIELCPDLDRVWKVRTNHKEAAVEWLAKKFPRCLDEIDEIAELTEPGACRFYSYHEVALGLCPLDYAKLFTGLSEM